MEPAFRGYLVAGTYSWELASEGHPALRIFIRTPLNIIARRMTGQDEDSERAEDVVRTRVARFVHLRSQEAEADFVIDGTASRLAQRELFREEWDRRFGQEVTA